MLKYNKELEDIFIKNNIPYRNNIKINKLQKEIDNFNRIFYLSLAGYKKDYKLYDYFRQRYLSNALLTTDIFKIMEAKSENNIYLIPKEELSMEIFYPLDQSRITESCFNYIFEKYKVINYENILFNIFSDYNNVDYCINFITFLLNSKYKDKLNFTSEVEILNDYEIDSYKTETLSFTQYLIRLPEIIKCDNEDACIKINNFILHLININLVPKIKVKKLILYAAKCNSHMVITLVKTLDNFTFINNKIISDYWWLKDLELYNLFLKYYKTKLSHILPLKIYTWDDEDLSYIKPEMLKFIDINKHIALHIIKNNKLVHLQYIIDNKLFDFDSIEFVFVSS